jgi:hypothetical protein
MRRLGYQVVDLVVDALAELPDRPPSRRAGPEELAGLLNEPVPRAGADPEQVLRQAVEDVLGPAMQAVPAAGGRLRAGPRRRSAGVDLLHPPRVPARRGHRRPRNQLHPPWAPAHPQLPGVLVAPTRLALVSFGFANRSRTPEELEAVNRRVADAMLVDELATSARLCSAAAPSCACAPSTPARSGRTWRRPGRVEELARSG